MNKIIFLFVLGLSKLPFWLLYRFSDVLYYVLFYIVRYRKSIVLQQMKDSFPEKSQKEILKIRKKFFRNLADYFIEMIISLSITKKEFESRIFLENLEVMDQCRLENKNILLLMGHVFNWEWIMGIASKIPTIQTYAIYRPIENKFLDEKVSSIRSRYNNIPVSMKNTPKTVLGFPNNGNQLLVSLSDQTPHKSQVYHTLEFLHQETPVFIGYDKLAIKKDMAVVYCQLTKLGRGKYKYTLKRIMPKGDVFEPLEMVHAFFEELEKTIRQTPDNWLWTHRRWKYKKGRDF